MCDQVWSLEHLPQNLDIRSAGEEEPRDQSRRYQVRSGKLYLKLDREDGPLLPRIKDLFQFFPGGSPAVIYCADTGRKLGAVCLLHDALLEELRLLLGEKNVVLKEIA